MSAMRLTVCLLWIALLAGCSADRGSAPAEDSPAMDTATLLRTELERVLAQRGIELDAAGNPTRAVSALPKRDYRAPARFNDIIGERAQLSWVHHQLGDYDHNGEVNISDLTPVGIHLGKTSASPDWLQAQAADGDGNNEINIADVTPIGQNFGAALGGYLLQISPLPGDPFEDYAFVDFAEGFDNGNTLEFGYSAPDIDAADYRVSPVGRSRDFDWDVYRLELPGGSQRDPELLVADGRLMLAAVSIDSADLIYAESSTPRPHSSADWSAHVVDTDNVAGAQPGLAMIGGAPAIGYCAEHAVSAFEVRYARALVAQPLATTDWQHHMIEGSLPLQSVRLLEKDGLPVLTVENGSGGLFLGVSPTPFPSSDLDWSDVAVNAGVTVNNPEICLIGNRVHVASYQYGGSGETYYSGAKFNIPTGAADFDSFPLWTIGGIAQHHSILGCGGYPAVLSPNEPDGSLDFLYSSEVRPLSAFPWFVNKAYSDPTDILHPDSVLFEGRPAVACGRFNLNFIWGLRTLPRDKTEWTSQESLEEGTLNFGIGANSIVVSGELPLIAFTEFDAPNGVRHIAIAIANER
ncbi:hypothetical protein KDL44_11670 [bacterium]|nr:hypothetical protein [bacterium]